VVAVTTEQMARKLLLGYIAQNHEYLIDEAKTTKMSHADFLKGALAKELSQRDENRIQRRIREARLPYRKYLQDLDTSRYIKAISAEIEELSTLDFINAKENAIFISNPGRGKTHLAIGLGVAACLKDKRVLFTNVPNLVIELKEAMSKSEVTAYRRKFEKFDLVIIDELGYVSFDKQGSEILFNLLSNRNESGSMIITSNLAFEKWEEVFHDTNLTGALVDRLAHRAHILDMSGNSFRVDDTKQWLGKTLDRFSSN
jgi:DNA replication protein DnaC